MKINFIEFEIFTAASDFEFSRFSFQYPDSEYNFFQKHNDDKFETFSECKGVVPGLTRTRLKFEHEHVILILTVGVRFDLFVICLYVPGMDG